MQLAISRAAAGVLLLCSAPAMAQLHVLPYRLIDAKFSRALNRPVLVSSNPNALHVLNVDRNTGEIQIPLPSAPTSVAVSTSAPYAAVGHASAVSYVDLTAATPPVVFRVEGDVQDLALSSARIHVLSRRADGNVLFVIELATGIVTEVPGGAGARSILEDPKQPGRYLLLLGGVIPAMPDFGGELLPSPAVAGLSASPAASAYSSLRRESAAILGLDPAERSEVHFFASDSLTRTATLALPGPGRYLFYENEGRRLVVILQSQADFGSGEFGFVALPLSERQPAKAAPANHAIQGATAAITPLPYAVVDAAYSNSLDRIITVSANPNQLHVYDGVTNTETRTVALPLSPTSVAVSPDGNFAAVGFDGRVSRIDLRDGTIQTITVPGVILDVALSATRLYAANGTVVRSIDFAAAPPASTTTEGWAVRLALTADGAALFGAPAQGLPPERFRFTSGNAVLERRSNGGRSCDYVWPAAGGDRLFTGCGEFLRLSADPLQDLAPLGQFHREAVQDLVHVPARGSLYVLSALAHSSGEVRRLGDTDFTLQARIPIPALPGDPASSGRFLLANAAGTRLYVIASLNVPQLNHFGVYSFDLAAEPACRYTVSPSTVTVGGDGNGEAFISTEPMCRWEVLNPVGARFTSYSSGVGSGTIQISAPPNRGATTLTGTMTVEGQTFSLEQPPLSDCIPFAPLLTGPPRLEFGQNGGRQTFAFTMAPGCRWRASAPDSQVVTVSPESGFGTSTLTITVAPNTGLARTRAITLVGLSSASNNSSMTIEVIQAASGGGCTYEVNPALPHAPPFGGTVDVSVITGPGCAWTVAAQSAAQPWITFAPSSGTGTGRVTFTVAPSPSPDLPRSAFFNIGGQSVGVFQLWNPPAAGCRPDITAQLRQVPARGSAGTVPITQIGGCDTYQIVSSPSWFQVFPLEGTTPSNVRYTMYPNFSRTRRFGLLKFANGYEILLTQEASTASADERLVGHLYFSYMGRYPTDAEVAFHINDGLRKGLSRTDLVMNFFNAIEFNAGGRFVAGLYVGLLNRDAEFGGWLFQRNALINNIVSDTQIVSNFLGSAEWKLVFGTPTNTEFIRILYRYVLLREPGPPEVEFHLGTLARGLTRAQMAANFLNVPEFRAGTGPRLTAFLLYACLLGRDPSRAELTQTTGALTGGTPFRTLVEQVLATPEFAAIVN